MNSQNFGDNQRSSEIVERTDPDAPNVERPMGTPVVADNPTYETPRQDVRQAEPGNYSTPGSAASETAAALLSREEADHFRSRWDEIQGRFVDEPRMAVQQADELVSEVVGQLTRLFAQNHSMLESQWKQGNDVSTEDLRKALQRYRSFFKRLVV